MRKNKRGMIEKGEAKKKKTRECMRRLPDGASSNASNVSDQNLPIDIDVTNTPNLTNKNFQHTPIEMIMKSTPTYLMPLM